MGCICHAYQPKFTPSLKEVALLGSLIEGGDPVDDAVTCLSQKLRISGKLG